MGSYVPNTLEERKKMLQEIGYSSIEDLFAHIPEEVKLKGELNIPNGKSEFEVRREMEQIAEKNQVFRTIFRGAGAYRHFIPAMVKNVTSKENLLTAYTPYQAEISQGILQSIFEYQTMICDLTGMDVSNASVYDGATAAAEGVAMCQERKRHKALLSGTVPPYVLEVVETYCFGNGMELEVIPEKDGLTDKEYLKEHIDAQTACVYIQHPNYYGNLEDAEEIGEIVHDAAALLVMQTAQPQAIYNLIFNLESDIVYGQNFLTVQLPSGRKLYYPRPFLKENQFGKLAIHYYTVGQQTRKWEVTSTYGGKMTENIVQAIARDCLAETLRRIDAKGLQVVFHVHDEVIIDAPMETTVGEICDLMAEPIPWAPGLILKGAGFESNYYMKD